MSERSPLLDTVKAETLPRVAASKRVGTLVVIEGSEADLGLCVAIDGQVTLGRDFAAELPLTDSGISRRHAQVRAVEGRGERRSYEVRDLDSTNGTRLNGKKVSKAKKLADGDKIFLGRTVVRFTLADELEAQYHARLGGLLAVDDLTGLITKRRFDAAFAEALAAARAQGRALGVLMMDLDDLKQINDRHGHAVGAHTISQVGRVLGQVLSPRGLVTRFGGDEFFAYLPGCDRRATQATAEKVRETLRKTPIEKDGVRLVATMSIGVAVLPEDGETTEALFSAADRALYRVKRAGKDGVEG
ncbi:MAG: diguanylate cyclase domain-containing protein [Myxococcota bacterium]